MPLVRKSLATAAITVAAVGIAACGTAASQPINGKPVARITASSTPIVGSRQAPGLPAFQGGVIVYATGNDPSLPAQVDRLLDHLVSVKVNAVALAFPLYQTSWTAVDVHVDPIQTPDSRFIGQFIDAAHQRDLAVLLRPLIDDAPLKQSGHWRGQLQPANVGAWFQSYKEVLVSIATVAQAHQAEVIDVGTELNSLQGQTSSWNELIGALRTAYHGQLTYSGNWDVPYPSFAANLDFVSVDAFYPLAAANNASVPQLVAAWSPWVAKIQQLGTSTSKRVVLTELGTTSEVGSYRSPYDWHHPGGISLEAQRSYYAASCTALKPVVGGMYWWAYYANYFDKIVPDQDPGYQPMGKPAEAEIASCYR